MVLELKKPTKKLLMYDLLCKISEANSNSISQEDLSKIIIKIDEESNSEFVLLPVVYGLNGYMIPELDFRVQELRIFNILNETSDECYKLTEQGHDYITQEVNPIKEVDSYKLFSRIAKKIIKEYYK